jgi:uncharacterized protein (TIGR02271 family)
MTDQTIVAVYDTTAHAELAVQDLLAASVPESAITRHSQEGSYAGSASTPVSRTEEGGFWSNLFGGEPDHDTAVYDRSIGGGSSAVSVKVPEDHIVTVTDILERHHPIDLDERANTFGLDQTSASRTPLAGEAANTVGAEPSDGGAISLAEEALAVGKRVINRGTTRIRRFVVETPVEQQVSLRDEQVTIERNPVSDGRAVPGAAFTDKTIEMTETAEEAVVSKVARVTEEISLRKEATERTETVRDTVRREDVEIVKVPGNSPTGVPLDRAADKRGMGTQFERDTPGACAPGSWRRS